MFINAAVIAISAKAERTTAKEGTKVRNDTKTTIDIPINERIKDIGIMRATGASRGQIIKALIYEAIVIGISGGILGYAAGTVLAYIIGPIIFEGAAIAFVPVYLPVAIALALCISVLATLYPAIRATRIKVADAFVSL
jgi:putative ABC transport system permease protein